MLLEISYVVNNALGAELIPEISSKKNQQVFKAVQGNGNVVLKKAYGFAELYPSHDPNNFVKFPSGTVGVFYSQENNREIPYH